MQAQAFLLIVFCRYPWSTSFVPDYSAIVLAAKMCTDFHEHSMHVKISTHTDFEQTSVYCLACLSGWGLSAADFNAMSVGRM